MKKKTKKHYLINICQSGKLETIRCESKKEKDKWLLDYFTQGEEKWWAWDEYQKHGVGNYTFEGFVKHIIKQNSGAIYSIIIRRNKVIVIQEKEN